MALSETERLWRATKRGHMSRFLGRASERAKEQNLPFDIDIDFLLSITTDECPVFKTPFVWGQGRGKDPYGPSLDRIIPELGYVKYNVVFISNKANTIKQDITERELYDVADWLHDARKEVLKHVEAQQSASVSDRTDNQSEHDAKRRALLAARLREDRDDAQHHCGTISGDDIGNRPKEGS